MTTPSGPGPPQYRGFTIILRHTTSGRVTQRPLPDNTQHSLETPVPSVGFDPTIPSRKRPQIHALKSLSIWIIIINTPQRSSVVTKVRSKTKVLWNVTFGRRARCYRRCEGSLFRRLRGLAVQEEFTCSRTEYHIPEGYTHLPGHQGTANVTAQRQFRKLETLRGPLTNVWQGTSYFSRTICFIINY